MSTHMGGNNDPQTPNDNFDEINVGLSYQSSVPISQRFGATTQKPAAPGLKPQESISYSEISATSSAVTRSQHYD